jgi:hypothetical protein
VPLGETYLELVTVIDEAEAAQSPFGSWVADAHPALARPLGWAVRTDALDDVARRLGLAVRANSRATQSGQLLRWRVAADCVEKEMRSEHLVELTRLLELGEADAKAADFRRYGSARQLYNFQVDNAGDY